MLYHSALAIATTLLVGCAPAPSTSSAAPTLSAALANAPATAPSQATTATPVVPTQVAQSRPITAAQMGLAGFQLGSPEAELQSLGAPERELRDSNPNYNLIRIFTYANGLEITVADGAIAAIYTENPEFATLDGVRVGDSRSQIVATYGEPEVEGDSVQSRLSYYDDQGSYLGFDLTGDRIVGISTGWLMD